MMCADVQMSLQMCRCAEGVLKVCRCADVQEDAPTLMMLCEELAQSACMNEELEPTK